MASAGPSLQTSSSSSLLDQPSGSVNAAQKQSAAQVRSISGNNGTSTKKTSSPNCQAFFRSIGLNIITFLGYSDQERPKVILTNSYTRALARCCVHIIPVLAELVVIWVGFYGVLFGDGYAWQLAFMQVVAKVMELLAVGSLATIVLHILRSKLLKSKEGLPFGLLAAGFSFTQINWFWSPAFLFSLRWSRTQIFSTATIILCGLLALAMGPATATLLVPILRVCISRCGTGSYGN